jgi:hypothetical protein
VPKEAGSDEALFGPALPPFPPMLLVLFQKKAQRRCKAHGCSLLTESLGERLGWTLGVGDACEAPWGLAALSSPWSNFNLSNSATPNHVQEIGRELSAQGV